MMDDQVPRRGPKPRLPLDIFDPSGDGIEGFTLAEAVDAGTAACEALKHFEAALQGCMTPLSLSDTVRVVDDAVSGLEVQVRTLRKVQQIIEQSQPLLPLPFNGGNNPDGANRTLSPEEILRLHRWQQQTHGEGQGTPYREMAGPAAVPQLVRIRRAKERLIALQEAAEAAPLPAEPSAEERKAATSRKRAISRTARRIAAESASAEIDRA